MFTYSTQPRGSVVHALYLAEALQRLGHEVTVFALSKNGSRFWRDVACEVALLPAAEAPAELDALIAQRIAEVVSGLSARAPALDLLHAQDCLVANALIEARRSRPALSGCPLVRTVHHVERFASPYLVDCQRRSVLSADLVLSVSRMTSEDVWRTFERESLQVSNGVDLARFDRALCRPRPELRRELRQAEDAFLVLSVGGVEPRKNSRRCLAAMASVCERLPGVRWLIAGGASVLDHRAYREQFEADLASLPTDVQRRIIRTGPLGDSELTALYLASDVLLGASEHEGFGLSVLEAMAAGLPAIVPLRPPFTEYVPERAARFVDPESVQDITEAVLELERSAALRARLAEVGPDIAAAYSWESSAREHARIYALAAAQGHGARRRTRVANAPAKLASIEALDVTITSAHGE
jgi:glycosyltransferase-like protein